MNVAVPSFHFMRMAVRISLVLAFAGAVGTGCSRGGGSGQTTRNICAECDEDSNTPVSGRVIIPDGRNFSGEINYPGDEDWFRFRGIAGVFYTLQIEGFPPNPEYNVRFDLTGDGVDILQAEIRVFDALTQLQSTTGTQGGTPYDINAAGVDSGTLLTLGDSRIVWACPLTNDYYIRIRHRRNNVGVYELRLATSQLMTIFQDEPQLQTGARFVSLSDDDGEFWDNWVSGGIKANRIEFVESFGAIILQDLSVVGPSAAVFLRDATDPEVPIIHMHVGYPNVYVPEDSLNITDNGDPEAHASILSVPFNQIRSADSQTSGFAVSEAVIDLGDDGKVRIPVTITPTGETQTDEGTLTHLQIAINVGDAAAENPRGIDPGDLSTEILRTFFGFEWYFDLHPQSDMGLDSEPVAVSLPEADLYQFFETALVASPSNVVREDGTHLSEQETRGFGNFNIFYDSSLRTFQVAAQSYYVQADSPSTDCGCGRAGDPVPGDAGGDNVAPPDVTIIQPDYATYAGNRVRVRRGGPGETGPVLIDLGTLPTPRLKSFAEVVNEDPGFRLPIRQLTDGEAELLREEFYNGSFYVEVTNQFTGAPVARAEGLLEISTFPYLEPCAFCFGSTPAGDGSYHRGTVNFATTSETHGAISVVLNGEKLGSLIEAVSKEDLPSCGTSGDSRTLAAELWPEKYFWHASAEDGTSWQGFVTIGSESCETVLLE